MLVVVIFWLNNNRFLFTRTEENGVVILLIGMDLFVIADMLDLMLLEVNPSIQLV